jgi:hypothetical protein
MVAVGDGFASICILAGAWLGSAPIVEPSDITIPGFIAAAELWAGWLDGTSE